MTVRLGVCRRSVANNHGFIIDIGGVGGIIREKLDLYLAVTRPDVIRQCAGRGERKELPSSPIGDTGIGADRHVTRGRPVIDLPRPRLVGGGGALIVNRDLNTLDSARRDRVRERVDLVAGVLALKLHILTPGAGRT